MFTITEKAAAKFNESLQQIGEEGLILRLSARRHPDHGIVYNMGFDRLNIEEETLEVAGIKVCCDEESQSNTNGMVIDFGEHEGIEQFIFMNPNDGDQADPESCGSTAGSSSCGTGCSCG
ncbi:MAG: iron-sulfur cluster biosynthesis family protein [bacterium]|nr:iron-sulfur cluster biosynthesis family protein [bacterium]